MIVVDEALKIINKFIPDKNAQSQMEIELKKLVEAIVEGETEEGFAAIP